MSTQSADQRAEIEQILLDFILDANADPINQPEFAAAFAAKLADFVTVWGGELSR